MTEREIVEAEIVEEEPQQETRVTQVTPELEIERLKTRRAELATARSKARWNAISLVLFFGSAFFSCAHCIQPW